MRANTRYARTFHMHLEIVIPVILSVLNKAATTTFTTTFTTKTRNLVLVQFIASNILFLSINRPCIFIGKIKIPRILVYSISLAPINSRNDAKYRYRQAVRKLIQLRKRFSRKISNMLGSDALGLLSTLCRSYLCFNKIKTLESL